ncbi:MAG: hypothetical protein CM15mP92_2710 [Halieaceae bacterium]|nr:MAG: hypothetical protein CM15mP92_2710 [Halieaceae bacterium]
MSQSRPLEGLRVVELGQLLAGPFAGTILGYFGAEVIKVEPPTGDPIRQWREVRNGMSLWYHSLARNKKASLWISNQSAVANWPSTYWQKPTLLSKTSDRGHGKLGVGA